jgi:hypothetical protein
VVIETVLRVAPAAAAPGLALAMTRRAESWGWPATIGIIAVMILAVALATQLGGWAWRRIRARGDWSVARRALTGSGAIAASFVGMLVAAFAVTAAVGGSISPGTAVALPRDPCAAEKLVLERSGPPAASTTWTTTLADLVLADPGVPATRDFDGPLSLNGAARTRADPDARAKLEAAGFAEAYQRTWDTPDGRVLFAEIFAFRDSAGAMQFHRQTIEYSCRFSNMAFEAPFAASVGQQLRYAGAESIVDQVHWVDGRYRIIVFHSFAAPPEDHTAVIDLAKRADHRLRSAE